MQQKEHRHFQHQNTCLQGQHGEGQGLGAAAKFQIIHTIPYIRERGQKAFDFLQLMGLLNPDALKLNKIFQLFLCSTFKIVFICRRACTWLI